MKIVKWLRLRMRGIDEQGVNVRLVRKVAAYIRKYPDRYNQDVWFEHNDVKVTDVGEVDRIVTKHICGTVGCVAGNALILSGKYKQFSHHGEVDWSGGACKVLGIDRYLAEWLFASGRDEDAMPFVLDSIANGVTDIDLLEWVEDEQIEIGSVDLVD